jgi:peptidyl-prolyl cis-trans isomerase B (cyclophilin B)
MLKKVTVLLCIAIMTLTGCSVMKIGNNSKNTQAGSTVKSDYGLEQLKMPEVGEEIAVMTTNKGTIKLRLFPKLAPKAVENFTTHAKDGYYNGLTFHRVMNDFMIQGGDPEGTGRGGESIWGKPFEDEFSLNLHNVRGALSMANSGQNTNGSQFFIVQAKSVDESLLKQMAELNKAEKSKGYFSEGFVEAYKNEGGTPWLDYVHTVFGQVFEGMDIVDAIAAVETGEGDKPKEDVIIQKIEIVKYAK